GDGAGILIQMPHEFFREVAAEAQIRLPGKGYYGSGLVFLPRDRKERDFCKRVFLKAVTNEGQVLLGWRSVPVDNTEIGNTARETEPVIEQVFIGRNRKLATDLSFERVLYGIRKKIEHTVRCAGLSQQSFFYITNLSCRTFSYKGLLMPGQLKTFFRDLGNERLKSSLCLVHSRYSTNTFPAWDLAQPFRFLAHNGEINTLRGNINWMRAREGLLRSEAFGKDLKSILPVIVPGGSDSAALDNVFELLVLGGRDIAHAMMMLIPAAWQENRFLSEELKGFYEYHSCITEPWDGPAAIAFTDGIRIGAVLDRNGLRPARYLLTKEGLVVMASEVGVLDIPAQEIIASGRLEPGKMFFIDTALGLIVDDEKIKEDIARRKPYHAWAKEKIVHLETLPAGLKASERPQEAIPLLLSSFGYTREDMRMIIRPMAAQGQEPIGSMGNDVPHAVLSLRPQLLYAYFKQLFAQVTNPAVDSIREELVMSLSVCLGPEQNMLTEGPEHCHKLKVDQPILTNEELSAIQSIQGNGFKTKSISILFNAKEESDFLKRLTAICKEAESAIRAGYTFLVLSDRGSNEQYAALPALLATATLHHHLIKQALRTQVSILLESAEPREVHHFALLFGYGADCVNPYLAYKAIASLCDEGDVSVDFSTARDNYRKAVAKGILKILSKMGISTLQSYRGAQIFEALGLHQEVIERSFPGTVSRIAGADFKTIARETIFRHEQAYKRQDIQADLLPHSGLYQWRKDGESHLWNPDSIAALQDASRTNDYARYKEFASCINNQEKGPVTLRSLFKFKETKPVPIAEVEPFEAIARRFVTGAMSFGSISRATHETIAIAMNQIGGKSNTGEGGEDPVRFSPRANGTCVRSAIKQVASGRFGVTTNYLVNADELQIKIAQGAKPGEGGQLPGHKVSATIAKIRYTTPGVTLISPPPHHDIYSIEDLAQLIFDLKNTNPSARISVKLVSEIGVGTVAAGVAKGHADMILVSGGDGGTGASPLSSIRHAGLPWELGLSEVHQTLVLNNLRNRVRLQTDGQMRTGRDVAIAAMLGAEEFGFCTSVLIVLGCVMLRHCHLNNCSVGIATQDEALERRFTGRPEHIIHYFRFVAEELREIMAQLGIKTVDELIGRSDLLALNQTILPWKAASIDYSKILYKPNHSSGQALYCTQRQDHGIGNVLDMQLIEASREVFSQKKSVAIQLPIRNTDRTTGAMLSGQVCKMFGEEGLPDNSIHCTFRGIAGQSFGAWLAKGITFELEGMANDYVGKGVSGGKIIIYPDRDCRYVPQDNVIIGNTGFYGAITGEAYIRGRAGERFCIRNSGIFAVVEGVGDHGCEYMTGGRVIVLGDTGRNFAAGMSGGIAYVYDPNRRFCKRCNLDMVELETLDMQDKELVARLLGNHVRFTKSALAATIADNFDKEADYFVKVMPFEYKRALGLGVAKAPAALAEISDG
ncbi:MAG: glutamate synthase large subunit, partial [Candidatus Omnitrophota bacterium]